MDFTNHPLKKHNSYSNSTKIVNTIAIAIDDRKLDAILDEFSGLYPDTYRAWHAKWIKQHGSDTWIRYARTAQQEGRTPQKHLVWLLNRHT